MNQSREISPELALVDPELAAQARQLLPEPGSWGPKRPNEVVASHQPVDATAAGLPTHRRKRSTWLALIAAASLILSGLLIADYRSGQIQQPVLEVQAPVVAPQATADRSQRPTSRSEPTSVRSRLADPVQRPRAQTVQVTAETPPAQHRIGRGATRSRVDIRPPQPGRNVQPRDKPAVAAQHAAAHILRTTLTAVGCGTKGTTCGGTCCLLYWTFFGRANIASLPGPLRFTATYRRPVGNADPAERALALTFIARNGDRLVLDRPADRPGSKAALAQTWTVNRRLSTGLFARYRGSGTYNVDVAMAADQKYATFRLALSGTLK